MRLFRVLLFTGIFYSCEVGKFATTLANIVPHTDKIHERIISNQKTFRTTKADSAFIQEKNASNTSDEDVRIVRKTRTRGKKRRRSNKKRMRKMKVRPRGGRHIKDAFQDHRSMMKKEPVNNTSSETSHSEEDLLKLCNEARDISKKFGISDVTSFVDNHCGLIRLYFTEFTCEQLNVFMLYCRKTGAIQ